jgi:hypothetical protein
MRNRMYRKLNAVLHANFAQQLGYVGFHGALFDA